MYRLLKRHAIINMLLLFGYEISETIIYYLCIGTIFLISSTLNRLFQRSKSVVWTFVIPLTIILSLLLFSVHLSLQEETKYKEFGVKRNSSTQQIKSRYRYLSKTIHPDSNKEDNGITFEELSDKLEFLVNKSNREFYDKYDRFVNNDDLDEKELKQVQSLFFQLTFYKYANISFLWICLFFFISKLTKSNKLINPLLKLVILKTFIQILYVYLQDIESSSFFDFVFPYLPIHRQIYYFELLFSYFMGYIWNLLYKKYIAKKDRESEDMIKIEGMVRENEKENEESIKQMLIHFNKLREFN